MKYLWIPFCLLLMVSACSTGDTSTNNGDTTSSTTKSAPKEFSYRNQNKTQYSDKDIYTITYSYPEFVKNEKRSVQHKINSKIKSVLGEYLNKFKVRAVLQADKGVKGESILNIGYVIDRSDEELIKISFSISEEFPDLDKPRSLGEVVTFKPNEM